MDFVNLLSKLTDLQEDKEDKTQYGGTKKETKKGVTHKAGPGRYGGYEPDTDPDKDDDDKSKAKKPTEKRGRGRPPSTGAHTQSPEEKKKQKDREEAGKSLQSTIVGNLPKGKLPGKPGKKHSLKEWVQEIEQKYVMEADQPIPVVSKQGSTQSTGAGFLHIDDTSPSGQALSKAVQGLAQQKKAQIVVPTAQQPSGTVKPTAGATGQAPAGQQPVSEKEGAEDYSAKKARAGKDIGKPGKQFAKIAKSAGEKYGSKERGEKVAGAVLAKLRKAVSEADIPSDQVDMGAGLGAGRNAKTFEGKKPDFLDLDKDKNKKEPMSDAAKDAEKKKKKLKENAHRHSSARLLGKAHALAKEAYNCKYDDLDEVKMYHEGYKEGLDECYGQGVYETAPAMPPATVGGMANQATPAMEADMEEGNAFTAALAKTPPGGKFSVGGKTFTDRSNYDAKLGEMTFESWDKELNSLLSEDSVSEGMSVSISKGNQGSPDSVSVTAQDAEADQLLSMIKQSGLGLFGQDGGTDFGVPSDGEGAEKHGEIDVVGDHDGMMALIKKVTGAGDQSSDYENEEGHDEAGHEGHEHTDEETCNECGYMESQCQCDEEVVDETESYDQEEENVAEDNAPDSDSDETTADENAEAEEDQALAMNEWANDAGQSLEEFKEETFTTDKDFMLDTISSGLNKKKTTVAGDGQTTVPVTAVRTDESILDFMKLAGIK